MKYNTPIELKSGKHETTNLQTHEPMTFRIKQISVSNMKLCLHSLQFYLCPKFEIAGAFWQCQFRLALVLACNFQSF